MIEQILQSIMKHEGFESKPYPDPMHGWDVPTFGHGLTYLTKEESEHIVKGRILELYNSLDKSLHFFKNQPIEVRQVLVEMSYQMGVHGVLNFQNMLAAINEGDYQKAAKEGLDSKWAKQTPSRAKKLMDKMAEAR
jgi:lysozyme